MRYGMFNHVSNHRTLVTTLSAARLQQGRRCWLLWRRTKQWRKYACHVVADFNSLLTLPSHQVSCLQSTFQSLRPSTLPHLSTTEPNRLNNTTPPHPSALSPPPAPANEQHKHIKVQSWDFYSIFSHSLLTSLLAYCWRSICSSSTRAC